MSDKKHVAYLSIEMDLESFACHISGEVPNVNMSKMLATILRDTIELQWEAANAPKPSAITPPNFLPPFRGRQA